jgi:hypothetical protein
MDLFKATLAAALFAVSSVANAIMVTDTEDIGNFFDTWGETVAWDHYIGDDVAVGSVVESAGLELYFTDDSGGLDLAIVVVELFDFQDGGLIVIDSGIIDLDVGLTGLASLTDTGYLDVSVTGIWGNFALDRSVLTAHVASVPEPGTLVLLGLGLVGIGFASSQRKLAR